MELLPNSPLFLTPEKRVCIPEMEQEPVRQCVAGRSRHLVARELFRIRLWIEESFIHLLEPSLIVVDCCDPYSPRLVIRREFESELKKGTLRMDEARLNAIETAFRLCYPENQAATMVPVLLDSYLFLIPREAFEVVLETEFDYLVTEATMAVFPGGGDITLRRFHRGTEREVRSSIKQLCQEDVDWNEHLRAQVMKLLKTTKFFDAEDTSRDQANFCVLAKYHDAPCGFLIATVTSSIKHGRLGKETYVLKKFNADTDLLVYIDFAFLKEECRSKGMGSLICLGVINHLRENYPDSRLHIFLFPKPDNPKAEKFWSEKLQLKHVGDVYLHRLFDSYRKERMAEAMNGLYHVMGGWSSLLDNLPDDKAKIAFAKMLLEALESTETSSEDE